MKKLLIPLLAAAAIAALAAALVLDDDSAAPKAASTAPDGATAPPPGDAGGTMLAPRVAGEGMPIAQALEAETPDHLLVHGYLISDAGGLRLCSDLDGDACVGPALAIDGEPGIAPDGPEPVTVLGSLEGRTLRVVNLAAA